MLKPFLFFSVLITFHTIFAMNNQNSGKFNFIGFIPHETVEKNQDGEKKMLLSNTIKTNKELNTGDHTRFVFGYWSVFSCCCNVREENE